MKSIIARLEALETRSQQSIVLLVAFKDEGAKEICVAELKELAKDQWFDLDSVRIVSGDNPKELEEYIDTNMKILDEIVNNPLPNRNIEDYE